MYQTAPYINEWEAMSLAYGGQAVPGDLFVSQSLGLVGTMDQPAPMDLLITPIDMEAENEAGLKAMAEDRAIREKERAERAEEEKRKRDLEIFQKEVAKWDDPDYEFEYNELFDMGSPNFILNQ